MGVLDGEGRGVPYPWPWMSRRGFSKQRSLNDLEAMMDSVLKGGGLGG